MELGAQGAHLRTQYLGHKEWKSGFFAPNISGLFYIMRTQYQTASTAPECIDFVNKIVRFKISIYQNPITMEFFKLNSQYS